jgi:uncharacterized membrane protein YhaH (DUF805 family)
MVKLLFSFRGRINRSQYWMGGLIMFAVLLVAVIFTIASMASSFSRFKESGEVDLSFIPALLSMGALYLVAVWCGAALNVKRLHDRGRSGWFALLAFVPMALAINMLTKVGSPLEMLGAGLLANLASMLINMFFLIDLGMMPGKPEANQYGDPPRPGGLSSPPPARPSGPSGAEEAMARAIAARTGAPSASMAFMQPAARTSAPAAPPHAPAPAAPAPGAPKAFGRRAS